MEFLSLFKQTPVVSLEVFPPKADMPLDVIDSTLTSIRSLSPAFVSVTYGAGGSRAQHTADIAARIPDLCGCPALGHLTCVGHDESQLLDTLAAFERSGVGAVLALRGDVPADLEERDAFAHFSHASDLVSLIKRHTDLCVGAACYPEGHYQSDNQAQDLDHLAHKVDHGVDFLITQLFFDNEALFSFLDRARGRGIKVPVLAGVMPILNAPQILRMITLCGSSLPAALSRLFARYANDAASFAQAGLDYCCAQVEQLKRQGIDGFHVYTMNRPAAVTQLLTRTGLR